MKKIVFQKQYSGSQKLFVGVTCLLAISFLISWWILFFITKSTSQPQVVSQAQSHDIPVTKVVPLNAAQIPISELFALTNNERISRGLLALLPSVNLNQSAAEKCNHMVVNNYWSHNAPNGTTPWWFIAANTTYITAGENLGKEYVTARGIINGWMNSPTHKANMLNPSYQYVGYAVCLESDIPERLIVVQHLVGY